MGIQLRSINEQDVLKIGNLVVSHTSVDAYNALADAFATSRSGVVRSQAPAHTRKIIKLNKPTFNHVLGRSGCKLLGRVLGIRSKTWEGIVKFELAYDLSINELVPRADLVDGGNYLYGAEIAIKYIDELDIDKALEDCLYNALQAFCKDTKSSRSVFTLTRQAGDNTVKLVDGWYASYDPVTVGSGLKRGVTIPDIEAGYADVIFPNYDSRYTYLRNMTPDKSGLYGMLNHYIVVLPEEMRPSIDNKEHALTQHYTKVLSANYKLSIDGTNSNPRIVMGAYKALEYAVCKLQYKNQNTAPDVAPDDLAVLERIKSKKGQIRRLNIGKRQDYSGRAVVCINPYLPLDVIRVPRSMLPKLLEYHALPYLVDKIKYSKEHPEDNSDAVKKFKEIKLGNLDSKESREAILSIIESENLLDDVPMVLGRQPTLHKQSLQGFHIEETPLQAIEVNPTVCPAFNMDFDGDQGHLEVPLSPEAIREVNDLVLTTHNLFLAKTGECTTEPRQDMLYGLWLCTRNTYKMGNPVSTFATYSDVKEAVIMHKIRVSDTVTCAQCGGNIIAGDAAFMSCFPVNDITVRQPFTEEELSKIAKGKPVMPKYVNGKLSVVEISKKTMTPYINHLLRLKPDGTFVNTMGTKRASTETFVGAINALVELGFKVARLYPPNMSLAVTYNDVEGYDDAIPNFHKSLEEVNLYYNIGMETADNYKHAFSTSLKDLNEKREGMILDKLGEDNGYVKLSVSGARGSTSNLVQAFSIKGQVKKNNTEAFDALITSSYASQLTPMEGFVTAFGGRQGQIDKSLKTGDTGYAMRQMWHATPSMNITCNDCGTNDGLLITKKSLIPISEKTKQDDLNADIGAIMCHAIVGRYTAGSQVLINQEAADKIAASTGESSQAVLRKYTLAANTFITDQLADMIAMTPEVSRIRIRSPLTCNNPCCAKCYGTEWSTHKPAVVGTPVGIIAAQSIGEPGTQLTLKQFQKGGVAGKAEATSAFDKVDKYIHVASLAKANKRGEYPGYDPIAWVTGNVIKEPSSKLGMVKVSIEGDKKKRSIILPEGVKLKSFVERGEGLSYTHGDYDLHEIMQYGGTYDDAGNCIEPAITAAQRYLIFKLFALYRSEVEIRMVHFEVLVASMTRYMITATDRDDLMIGQYATSSELYAGDITHTEYIPRLIGVKRLPNSSHEALDSFIMESPVEGLSRVCLLGMKDSLTKPLNRMVLGQTITSGSTIPTFIDDRSSAM